MTTNEIVKATVMSFMTMVIVSLIGLILKRVHKT